MLKFDTNISAYTKVREEVWGTDVTGARADIPLQPMEQPMVRQAVHLPPMEVHGRTEIHLQPMGDPTLEQMCVPKGDLTPEQVFIQDLGAQ